MRCIILAILLIETDVVAVPLIYELKKDQTVDFDFHFLNGLHEVPRFPGLEKHFQGPFFQHYAQATADINKVILALQSLPDPSSSPEHFARQVRRLCPGDAEPEAATQHVMNFASNSALGPFDGLLGFSEGASVVANVLIEQERSSLFRPFKCAVLVSGTPPLRPDNGRLYLTDETGERINTPTAHILGEKDPGKRGGLALFNLCTKEAASLYEHKQGHEIPKAPAITRKMAELIREMVAHVEEKS